MPTLQRSRISPKISSSLPTLLWSELFQLMRKNTSQFCQLCLYLKEAKLVQKYPQLCQLCLGFKLFQFMRRNISQLCQLCLDLNDAKLVQTYPQLCQLCLGYELFQIFKEKYFSTLSTLPIIKRSKISSKIFPTLPRV